MEQKRHKLRSTTFWLTLVIIVLNPVAWVTDYVMRLNLIRYIVSQGINDVTQIENLIVELPLTSLATAAITAVTAYIAGNKARNVSGNLQTKTTNTPQSPGV